MAHHSDGSSVQKHSAGSHYPFVVVVREYSHLGFAYVKSPDGSETGMFSFPIVSDRLVGSERSATIAGLRLDAYAKAYAHADRMAKALREVQAWAAQHVLTVNERRAKLAEAIDTANARAKAFTGWRAQVMAEGDAGLEDFA